MSEFSQQYDHDHIARCTCCGAWELVTEVERRMRAADLMPHSADCEHLISDITRKAS